MRNVSKIFVALMMLSLFSACLTYETAEYVIHFNDDLKSGDITVYFWDIGTTDKENEKQRNDFEQLVKDITDDDFLLDALQDGIYVRERKMFEKDGKLNAYFKGIFRDLQVDGRSFKIENNERILVVKNDEYAKIETNGKMYETDENVVLVWPKEKKEVIIKFITGAASDKSEETYPLVDFYRQWKNQQKN